MTPKSENGIIWATSLTRWSTALAPTFKSVLGGPKNYEFMVFCPSTGKRATKCKVKGITLNYENSKTLTLPLRAAY